MTDITACWWRLCCCAGLAPGEAEALDQMDPRWQVNGKFGVLQFAQP
jgi:hypothetical protein